MSEGMPPQDPARVGRTCQIVVGALMSGILTFAVVAFVIARDLAPNVPVISLCAVGLTGAALAARFLVPNLLVATFKRTRSANSEVELMPLLAGLYQTKTIIGAAILEGAGFFNLVAYLNDKQVWTYGVVAALVAVMAVTFPSQTQFENWADQIKREL